MAVLLGATGAAFAPGLGGQFVSWDDDRFIELNEMIRSPSLENLRRIFAEPHFEAYHPLHLCSYLLDYRLFELWAPGYKLHNLALYLVCLLLLWLVLRRLGLTALSAWAGTLVFAVHPLHVETVVWATARKEPLSLAFLLTAILAYLRHPRSESRLDLVTTGLFLLALLTKTSTVVLPALLLLIDVVVLGQPWTRTLRRIAPLVALACAVSLYVLLLWQENEMVRPPPEGGAWGIVAIVGKTYWHHLAAAFWPSGLSPLYALDRAGAWDLRAIGGFASWTLLLAAALRWGRPYHALAILWAMVALVPVANVVPVNWLVQDRYALIATVGLAVAVAAAGDSLRRYRPSWWWAPALLAGALAIPLGATSASYAASWRDSLSLWQRATREQPQSYYAFLGLGHTLRDRGDLQSATEAYQRAVALKPELAVARINLCLTQSQQEARSRNRPPGELRRLTGQLHDQWSSPQGLAQVTIQFLRRGYLVCAALSEDRAFALRPPETDRLVRAASRWTGLGQGRRALRLLADLPEERLSGHAAALEVRAQAWALEGQPERARQDLTRSLNVLPRPTDHLFQAAQSFHRRGLWPVSQLYADVVAPQEEEERWRELRQTAGPTVRAPPEPSGSTGRNDHDQPHGHH